MALERRDRTVTELETAAYTIPTDKVERDGTLTWETTTIVVVQIAAGGERGLGYTYASPAAATVIDAHLAGVVLGEDVLSIEKTWWAMRRKVRNIGWPGVAATAISAVDTALWDLKARLLDVSLADLFGRVRDEVPLYASGGFLTYSTDELAAQVADWAAKGFTRIKIKVGGPLRRERDRLGLCRRSAGDRVDLFVDANGAYQPKEAIRFADMAREFGVTYYEEPVSSDDLAGMRRVRDGVPPEIDVAAGEYGFSEAYFRRMLECGAVDILQVDATRCGGYTGVFRAAALCSSYNRPLSTHTAPALHASAAAAIKPLVHAEYFHDHVRIEKILFDGLPVLHRGAYRLILSAAGHGLSLKPEAAASPYRVHASRHSADGRKVHATS